MFNELFGELGENLKAAIQSCVGEGSELREAKSTPCVSLQNKVKGAIQEASRSENFPFNEQFIQNKINQYGGALTVYQECLHQLRT